MKYHAKSLLDIADHFESMAANVHKKLEAAEQHRTHPTRDMHAMRAEISTWQAAAEILRQTELSK